jgi:hypothetical protein
MTVFDKDDGYLSRAEKRLVKKAPLAPEILRVAEDDDGWPGREATTLGQAAARRRYVPGGAPNWRRKALLKAASDS